MGVVAVVYVCDLRYFYVIFQNSNLDFILYYNLLLCFIQLEMHVRLVCAIKFYLLTYLLILYPSWSQILATPLIGEHELV